MKAICEYCNKEFITYTYKRSKHHYCSKECAYNAHNTKIEVICEFCGKEFLKRKSEIKTHVFCSRECVNNWQRQNKIHRVCKTCNKEFFLSPSRLNQTKGYYCCLECRNKDKTWREKSSIKANLIQCKKKGLNKLELKGNEILDRLNIDYETQYLINNKICVDVYIPLKNLIIQWDGNYWHGKNKNYDELEPRIRRRVDLDKSQDAYLKKCGYKVLRFWEDEIKKESDKVYDNIKRAIQ